jgi:hypothetical protein
MAGDQVPVIPLMEVVGKADKVAPVQIAATCVNVGMVGVFTVIIIVCETAHCPEEGLKVYVVVAELLIIGDQVPAIPLVEFEGKAANVEPAQIAATCVNVGTIAVPTVIVIVWVVAHCPELGVNVYVFVIVLSKAGDQFPVIPLLDVVGSTVNVPPVHIGFTCVNDGTIGGFTVIVIVCIDAHCPTVGLKVYVFDIVLSNAGVQVPAIPLLEVVGNADNASPEQIGATCVNVGVVEFTVIVIV